MDADSSGIPDVFFASAFSGILLYGSLIVLLILFIGVSFWISTSEVVLFSLSRRTLLDIQQKYPLQHKQLTHLLDHSQEVLTTMILVNTFVNIGIIFLTNILLKAFLMPTYQSLTLAITLVVEIFLLVIFTDITPKIWAVKGNIRFVLTGMPGLYVIFKMLFPFARVITRITHSSEQFLNILIPKTRNDLKSTDEQFDHALSLTRDSEHKKEEIQLLRSIVQFKNTKVKQVMRPQIDICAIEVDNDFGALKQFIIKQNYSRIPVFKKTLDNIVGVLHVKDLLPHLQKKNTFRWQELLHEVFVVYEFNDIETLFIEFKKQKVYLAIVLDEFGSTKGIITLEDILEEIVGDIRGEFDKDTALIRQVDHGVYVAEGKVSLNDFARHFRLSLNVFEHIPPGCDSLAGLFLEIAKRLPTPKERVFWNQFIFVAEKIQKNRITQIGIFLNQ